MEDLRIMFGRQADFFDRLRETTDFRVSDLAIYCDVSESTATRKVRGQTELGMTEARLLVARHPDPAVGDALADYLVEGAKRTLLVIEDTGGDIGEDTAASLEGLAQFIRERAAHQADGIVTQAERDGQVATVKRAARDVHRLLHAVANQPVSARRQARPLKIGGGA